MRVDLIQSEHLERKAFLYIRQSTLKQVRDNKESTRRQYDLKNRAIELGWSQEVVEIIDDDLGISGSGKADREGFNRLVMEVSLGKVGLVMGLEVSRLARNCSDWHRLLEICALSKTIIMDEDGIYDVADFNDRLVLGLKGAMSEAELHIIRSRMRGGSLSKARRGELQLPLPIGYVYDSNKKPIKDPDKQIRGRVEQLFRVFEEQGSAYKTVQFFKNNNILFPTRTVLHSNKVVFVPLNHGQATRILNNTKYAGIYSYGKKQFQVKDGKYKQTRQKQEKWHCFIADAHESYISIEQFKRNKEILTRNRTSLSSEQVKSPPREGSALLQGLVICGKCGHKMTVRYQSRDLKSYVSYRCQGAQKDRTLPECQTLPGHYVDDVIDQKIVEIVSPESIELAYAVREQIEHKQNEIVVALKQQVERAQYEGHLSQQRYLAVDPLNRLVADNLEKDWNEKLVLIKEALRKLEIHEKERTEKIEKIGEKQISQIARDFKKAWLNPKISSRDKKRIIHFIIEDATIKRTNAHIELHIRYRGRKAESYFLPLPKNPFIEKTTPQATVAVIDNLLNDMSEADAAIYLNKEGYLTSLGRSFLPQNVRNIVRRHKLASFQERSRRAGYRTADDIAKEYKVSKNRFKKLRLSGKIPARAYHGGGYLYLIEDPSKFRDQLTQEV